MRITVIGMGHLGMVAASALAKEGHHVTGVDVSNCSIEGLKKGKVALYEPGLEAWLGEGLSGGHLRFLGTEEFSGDLGDVALVTTGIPASEGREADLGQVRSALHWIRNLQPRNTTIVMKSTVPPGSGSAFAQRELRGLDVPYVSNPEFLREGRALQDWMHPDRIVAGVDDGSRKAVGVLKNMYAGIEAPYLVTDITNAEMLKYASNAFLATRISFINEMAALCEEVGASIDAVSEGLAMDARKGQQIHAGVGYGGSCLPIGVFIAELPTGKFAIQYIWAHQMPMLVRLHPHPKRDSLGRRRYVCVIWIRLPQVSSKTAIVTLANSVGSIVKVTPSNFSFSYSARMSVTLKDAAGMPWSNIPF